MSEITTNPNYLRDEQYRDASNLDARIFIHQHFSTNRYGWFRFVLDRLWAALPAAARVLEVGAGPGSLWLDSPARIPPGWQVTLTDFSPGMVEQARRALGGLPAFAAFREADVQALPYDDGLFDGVIANHMLYHVPDRPRALAELRRVLRPGGRLFAATNGAAHLAEQWQLLRRYKPDAGAWHGTMMHAFSLENGAAQLAEHFAQVTLHPYEDSLRVTEVEPLVRYMDSMALLPPGEQERFATFVAQEMAAAGGALRIGKVTGLFEAW